MVRTKKWMFFGPEISAFGPKIWFLPYDPDWPVCSTWRTCSFPKNRSTRQKSSPSPLWGHSNSPSALSDNGLINFCTFDYLLFHDFLTHQGKFCFWYKNSSIKTLEAKCANKSYTSDTNRALLPDPTYCIPPLLHSVSNTWSGFWWRRGVCCSATLDVGSTSCYWFFYAPGGFSLFNEQNSWFSVNFSENWPSLTPFSSIQLFEKYIRYYALVIRT